MGVGRPTREPGQEPPTAAELRRLVRGLHRILRDGEGNSSLIERFDELTRLLYCKAADERRPAERITSPKPGIS